MAYPDAPYGKMGVYLTRDHLTAIGAFIANFSRLDFQLGSVILSLAYIKEGREDSGFIVMDGMACQAKLRVIKNLALHIHPKFPKTRKQKAPQRMPRHKVDSDVLELLDRISELVSGIKKLKEQRDTVIHSVWGFRGERESREAEPKLWAVSYRRRLGSKAGIFDDHTDFSKEEIEGYAQECSNTINDCLDIQNLAEKLHQRLRS